MNANKPDRFLASPLENTRNDQPVLDDSNGDDDFAGESSAVRSAIAANQPPRFAASAIAPGAVSRLSMSGIILLAIGLMLVGWLFSNAWLSFAGAAVALVISLRVLWSPLRSLLLNLLSGQEQSILIAAIGGVLGTLGVWSAIGGNRWLGSLLSQTNWDAVGALGEVFGALGQILIAVLAVYIAWRQYVIEKDLTIQQNTITQQQTIDSFFQGISDLVLDDEGLLEDWPQERAIAEGRTAAIISSVDGGGKAKVIRFLSCARLLTPLRRDRRLGRAILDGSGGYEEDRTEGVRVIDLGVMLAGADLSGTDLRWTDLSEINLIRANLSRCDLVKTNFSRTILVDAVFHGANFNGTRLFYGKVDSATPRSRTAPPDYRTGEQTGAVIENADFSGVTHLSQEQRYYCCAWGGSKTRGTIPGGCEAIPNKLGR
ncbi:pentapeptide repeat-containing protein [Leptolyngbya sp. FACHB-36]|uniref:pentapeptide repeat-containing protein n=1 Tax=Leptolyngbya sp. FACHB-36 TaxID=2692808 RepID=UPI001680C6D9|nr:pentapeptide repeat-containing protein [Leptolyngbya sp. FACHB-36]MBD2019529.1 pentapeptide repeat-containing protein [Leptolyngbya sp. FACHB-36]